ncbi:MAG: hypothetical protein ABSA48_10130 [Terracidiphilus sp.]|jgi:hypothetical protein
MKVRELLQIEIWSKRTVRKIFVGLGIIFGIFVLGLVFLFLAEQCWITPRERAAARVALAQIDALQNLNSVSDGDFDAMADQATAKLRNAAHEMWTRRDRRIFSELMAYLYVTEVARDDMQGRKSTQQRHFPLAAIMDRVLNQKLDPQGIELKGSLRSELHKALD